MNVDTYIKNSLSIVTLIWVTMLFSCSNNYSDVQRLTKNQNMPMAIAYSIDHKYTNNGNLRTKMKAKELHDYSNRKAHPYTVFPKGVTIVNFESPTDSVTIYGDYAITYEKTKISELNGNVKIVNHSKKSVLETEQLFWDQTTQYVYTEQKFKFNESGNVYKGIGFESKEDLSQWIVKSLKGNLKLDE